MSGERWSKIIYKSEMEERRDRGRNFLRGRNGGRKTCDEKSLNLGGAKVLFIER